LSPPFASERVRALLLDIEGTTTPIDFVFHTLFPFAAGHLGSFLARHRQEPEVLAIAGQLAAENREDRERGAPGWNGGLGKETLDEAAAYVRWLMSRDSKGTALKALQGRIWEEGFSAGLLRGEVYPDVAPAFARWRAAGRRLAIFSSGSVLAQRLLFRHSTAGDLSASLEAYFDTATGAKREAASYAKIAAALGRQPGDVLFLSDTGAELDAARHAGLATAHSLRPGVTPLAGGPHPEIRSFAELL